MRGSFLERERESETSEVRNHKRSDQLSIAKEAKAALVLLIWKDYISADCSSESPFYTTRTFDWEILA